MGSRHLSLLLILLSLRIPGNLTASPDCTSLFHSFRLSTWNNTADCCTWHGVTCDPLTGRILDLDLSDRSITVSSFPLSLFNLTALRSLDLSYNAFDEIPLPPQFENLHNLTHLNLSNTGFAGQIPIELASLTNLVSLDLSTFYLQPLGGLALQSPDLATFLSNLSNLNELYLDGVNISTHNWGRVLSDYVPGLTALSLTSCSIFGPIDTSLSKLVNLTLLQLDQNQLNCSVPDFFANFSSLRVLKLRNCGLRGEFPRNVFTIAYLEDIELSSNPMLSGTLPEFPVGSRIQNLVMTETNFSGNLPDSIGNMKMLSRLALSGCNFSGTIPASIANMTELAVVDFSDNLFSGIIPLVLPSGISSLSFASNSLNGSIPKSLGTLLNLTKLDLSSNKLSGPIPASLFALPSLTQMLLNLNELSGEIGLFNASDRLVNVDLSYNNISGNIPMSMFNLSGISVLKLGSNNFGGIVDLNWLRNLHNLSSLDLSHNHLSVHSGDGNSSLPFPDISTLNLASCNLTKVPSFLKDQYQINALDLSNNSIGGAIPSWIWGSSSLTALNLSVNSFNSIEDTPLNFSTRPPINIDIHTNLLRGPIPLPPTNPIILDYSNNMFSSIPPSISSYLTYTLFFSLANNSITGEISSSICNASYLQVLDLSNNNLTGSIPGCLLEGENDLRVLNLKNNNLSSGIPKNINQGSSLKTINLNGNQLEGEVPSSLVNCSVLEILDLGNNRIVGPFPFWLGSISSLYVLVLRSNKLHGPLVYNATKYSFPVLQILDLSSNNLSGNLPSDLFTNLKGMTSSNSSGTLKTVDYKYMILNPTYYQYTVTVTMKGLDLEFVKLLSILTSIDLSSNNFVGEIPSEIGKLSSLLFLTLSHNMLSGHIPNSLGNLSQLESFDLSVNMLSGEIPQVLTSLYFLSFLNLSHNRLVGKIPTGNQFSTFLPSSYQDNPGLCGSPLLLQQCGSNSANTSIPSTKPDTGMDWQFIFVGFGYGGGLAVFFGVMMVSGTGRKRYNEKVDRLFWAMLRLPYLQRLCQYLEARKVRDEEEEEEEEIRYSRKFCVFCTKMKLYEERLVLYNVDNVECECHFR